jgi:hypothetical protein
MVRWLIALGLLAAAPPAALAAPPLQRYAPVVVQDSAEQSPLTGVKAFAGVVPGVLDGAPQPTIYGRRAGNWLQYWLFYAANTQDRGIVDVGRHAGDWEVVQYKLRDGFPVRAVYSQHSGAESCSMQHVRTRRERPVVYVADGSHANYFVPGTRDRPWPDPNDRADGKGLRVRPKLVRITAERPPWMRYGGPWGGAKGGWVPGAQASPRGPAFQGVKWDDPGAWARSARRCTRDRCDQLGECDGRETGGAAIAAAFGAAWALLYGHRRLRRLPADG